MSSLLSELWNALTESISNIADAIKTCFLNLIYVDPDASEKVVSDFAKFGFMLIGLGLGFSLIFMIIRKIRG